MAEVNKKSVRLATTAPGNEFAAVLVKDGGWWEHVLLEDFLMSVWQSRSLSHDVLIATQFWPWRLEATSWLTPPSLFLLSILLLAGSVRSSVPLCVPLTAEVFICTYIVPNDVFIND